MGTIRVSHLGWRLPGGGELLRDVNLMVRDGERVALVGANGAGKSTLIALVAGDLEPTNGTLTIDGRVGVMRQFVGVGEQVGLRARDLLLSLAPRAVQVAAERLRDAEATADVDPMRYATALSAWGDAGGYTAEVHWDECAMRAVGRSLDEIGDRPLRTFSGGEQKRLALEVLLRGDADILVLDEPDNFLDVEAKRWLEGELVNTRKTVLYVSHDRELLAATATKVVTVESAGRLGDQQNGTWTHGGGFATYAEARHNHLAKLERDRTSYDNERKHLEELVAEMRRRARVSEVFGPKLRAAESRLRLFIQREERPADLRDQRITMRLGGARTGKRALVIEQLELDGLTDPFDLEVDFGERVAVLGGNGAGKSHFLRLLNGDETVAHHGRWRPGAGVVAGLFHQTHEHPEWTGRTLLEILHDHDVVRGPAMSMLRRYEIHGCAEQPFETLSGGQQARFQILLLERSGATMLLLDEPTDNLDLVSAEALEAGLAEFTGTVIAVTHDRWFLRRFDRFVVFGSDCSVTDHLSVPKHWATA